MVAVKLRWSQKCNNMWGHIAVFCLVIQCEFTLNKQHTGYPRCKFCLHLKGVVTLHYMTTSIGGAALTRKTHEEVSQCVIMPPCITCVSEMLKLYSITIFHFELHLKMIIF